MVSMPLIMLLCIHNISQIEHIMPHFTKYNADPCSSPDTAARTSDTYSLIQEIYKDELPTGRE
jgi:hypothetical protein